MNLIWATRGRSWGFRFLLDGGQRDPLELYEYAFSGAERETEVYQVKDGLVAIRFLDPEGRRDSAGRLIPHDIVALSPMALSPVALSPVTLPPAIERINSAADAVEKIWPQLAEAYRVLYAQPKALTNAEVKALLGFSC